MKKITFLLIALMLISTSYAGQQATQSSSNQNHSFYQSIKKGWNSFLDVLSGKGSRYSQNNTQSASPQNKPNQVTANPPPPKQSSNTNNNDSGSSFYDSVRSGWNSFIDVLSGPKQ